MTANFPTNDPHPEENEKREPVTASSPTLDIKRFYVKEQSCKVPHAPLIFMAEGKPETQVEMKTEKNKRENGETEVMLSFHVTLKINQQTALQLSIEQVGVFLLNDFEPEQEAHLLGAYCPGLLYPYVRKSIADLSLAAGFSAIQLPPINFDHVYEQQQQQALRQSVTPVTAMNSSSVH